MAFSLKTQLLNHQEQTRAFALDKQFIFDLSRPGTGKSLSFLSLVVEVKKKAVVACPPHLVNNWLAEAAKHTNLKASPHLLKFNPEYDLFVVPYTKIKDAEDIFKNVEVVGLDEMQYVKNLEAQRTRAVHTMLYKYTPKYFVGMTGTILKNRVPELYSPLILLGLGEKVEKKIIERYKSFYLFCNRFCNVKQTPFGNSYSGVKNLEELRSYLVPHSIKHTEDVLNLPELKETEVVVNYKDDPELMQAFLEFQDRGIRLESGAKAKSAEASAPFTASLVQSLLDQDAGPIVVFSDHPKALYGMELELSKKRVRVITGDTNLDKRTEYVKMLNTGQLDVLLCSTGSSSSGLTMTGSSTLIVNDPPFVPGDYEQLVKRVHRLSQEKECRIIKVLGSEVVGKIYKMLDAKNKTINKVTEGI